MGAFADPDGNFLEVISFVRGYVTYLIADESLVNTQNDFIAILNYGKYTFIGEGDNQ